MKIQDLRKQNAMSQVDLAKAVGVTQSCVSFWENRLTIPNVANLTKLAELFSVDISELVKEYVS